MPTDDDHLRDMVQAARKTPNHSAGLTRDDFYASELHQSAVKYELQVIGEAASNVSRETRDANPAIRWANIIGMRQHLVHGHRTVDLEIVWATVRRDVPQLLRQLEPLLAAGAD